ncbi:unnamed protein product [Acanthosepion pharaonis]|uniref:NADH dehydrogenase subunit 2 n=1 Tax=Acanthosepion pharaonis TaxID=158019 RepID=A0A812DR30_ACAPH|nr:unnamed protein product [Sepia pharaonis]
MVPIFSFLLLFDSSVSCQRYSSIQILIFSLHKNYTFFHSNSPCIGSFLFHFSNLSATLSLIATLLALVPSCFIFPTFQLQFFLIATLLALQLSLHWFLPVSFFQPFSYTFSHSNSYCIGSFLSFILNLFTYTFSHSNSPCIGSFLSFILNLFTYTFSHSNSPCIGSFLFHFSNLSATPSLIATLLALVPSSQLSLHWFLPVSFFQPFSYTFSHSNSYSIGSFLSFILNLFTYTFSHSNSSCIGSFLSFILNLFTYTFSHSNSPCIGSFLFHFSNLSATPSLIATLIALVPSSVSF